MLDKNNWSNMLISDLFLRLKANNDSIRELTDQFVKLNILQADY